MAEKRLDLVIDGSKARTGAVEAGKALTTIKNDATKLISALTKADKMMEGLGKRSNVNVVVQGMNQTTKATSETEKSLTSYEQALKNAEKAIQRNYDQLQLLNNETGKELVLTGQLVKQRKDAISTVTEETKAQDRLNKEYQEAVGKLKALEKGYGEQNQEVKQQVKLKEDLAKSQARLKVVQSDEYRQLEQTRKEIDRYTKTTDEARKASRNFERAMMGVGIAASMFSGTMIIEDLIRTADAYTELQNKLAVVTGSTEGLSNVTKDLVSVSIESRTSLAATTDLYSKLTRVNKEFGYSQEEVLTLTETVSKAVAMSGASASAAEGAVIQFAQALSNNFSSAGQELNSVIEQTPGLAETLAEGLTKVGNTGEVTTAKLKKLASEGLIKTRDVLEGLIAVSDDVSEKFALSMKTVTQSWQGLTDSFTVSLGKLNEAEGATKSLADTIDELALFINNSQAAVGALVGLLSGTALAVITGTAVALTSLVTLPVAGAIAGWIALSTAIGSIYATSADSSVEVERLTGKLENLDSVLTAITNKEVARNELEGTLGSLNDIDSKIDDLEKRVSSLNREKSFTGIKGSYDDSGMIVSDLNKIDKQLEELYETREGLQDFTDDLLKLINGDGLPETAKTEADAKRLTAQLEQYIATGDKLKKATLERDKALRLVSQAQDAVLENDGELSDEKRLMFQKAVNLAWDKYYKAIKETAEELPKIGKAWKNLEDSLKTQIKLLGMNASEASIYTIRMEAMSATQSDYQALLDEGLISQEAVNQKMREAADDAENLQKALNKLNAEKQINNSVNALTKPSGGFGQLQDISRQLEEAAQAGYLATEEQKATLYVNAYSSINTAFVDAIEDGNVASALYESFKAPITKALTDSLVDGGMSGKLAGAVGAGIANSIGQIAGGNTQAGIGGLVGTGIGSTFGPLGAVIGSSLGSVLGDAFKSETKQVGSGFKLDFELGEIVNAQLTKSFKKSSFLRSTKRWTEYFDLPLAELDSLAESLDNAANPLSVAAKSLGGSVEGFTGTLQEKNGSLADGIKDFTSKTAEASFASIEKFKGVGESFEAAFVRLGGIARTVNESLKLTGAGVLSGRNSQIQSRASELRSEYESAYQEAINTELTVASQVISRAITGDKFNQDFIANVKPMLEQAAEAGISYGEFVSRVGDGLTGLTDNIDSVGKVAVGNTIYDYFKDLRVAAENSAEILSRVGDTLKESVAEYNNRLIGSLAEIENISNEDAEGLLASLSQSFAENYLTEQERLENRIANARIDFFSLGFSESDLTASKEQVKAFYDQVGSPEERAKALAAADALAEYNSALEESNRVLEDALRISYYSELNSMISEMSELVSAEKETIQEGFESIFDSLNNDIDSTTESINNLSDVASSIKSAIKSVSVESDTLYRARRSSVITRLQEQVSSGMIPTTDLVDSASSILSSSDMSQFASLNDYIIEQSTALNALDSLEDLTNSQLTTEEKSLKVLKETLENEEESMDRQLEALDTQLEEAKRQSDLLQGIFNRFDSVDDVVNALKERVGVIGGDTSGSVTNDDIIWRVNEAKRRFGTDSSGALTDEGSKYLNNFAAQYGVDSSRIEPYLRGSNDFVNSQGTDTQAGSKPVVTDADLQWTINDAITRMGTNDQTWQYLYDRAKDFGVPLSRVDKFLDGTTEWVQAQGLPMFQSGGYTGDYGLDEAAGIVHGKEFVLNAKTTERLGVPTLNALNSGSGVVDPELRQLVRELINVVKNDSYNTNRKLVRLKDIYDIVEKWDEEGQPKERVY